MKLSAIISTLVGLAIALGLIAMNGFAEIGQAILMAGWGILFVIALHVPQMIFSSQAWRQVVPADGVPGLPAFVGLRLIREGVNALLPVAQIGGEFVAARLMGLRGIPLSAAGASVTVDLTLEMLSQVIFTLFGLGLLLVGPQDPQITQWILHGVVIALAILAAFVLAQRWGLLRLLERGLLKLSERQHWKGLEDIAGLHQAILSLYRSPRRLVFGTANHVMSWLLGGLEVWAALLVLGHPVGWREALIIESLGQAFRSLGFAVPGALGIQEGGLVLVCGLLGMSPNAAIELSLLKRVRELALGLPGLLAWQWMEKRGRSDPEPARDAFSEKTP
ncbi:flippase-like domain-containing protein [Telmatospirillum sp.]|uniref:flippase-like domain-containing protein n=1 Tax=Telmatospirillum sp. TaxID=2079197 RepID=UPI00283C5F51|nr:flippase-like domain-containing protein [Telmatospirillum sp.]MDR3440867.1 flippase-like domain-containing protein [Telmatospirillum sp.]